MPLCSRFFVPLPSVKGKWGQHGCTIRSWQRISGGAACLTEDGAFTRDDVSKAKRLKPDLARVAGWKEIQVSDMGFRRNHGKGLRRMRWGPPRRRSSRFSEFKQALSSSAKALTTESLWWNWEVCFKLSINQEGKERSFIAWERWIRSLNLTAMGVPSRRHEFAAENIVYVQNTQYSFRQEGVARFMGAKY